MKVLAVKTGVNGQPVSAMREIDKTAVNLGNVINTGDSNIPVENGVEKFTTGGAYTELAKKVDTTTYQSHITNVSNPHSVTASQVGLGNVVNTGDSATPISGGTTKFTTGGAYTELGKKIDTAGTGLSKSGTTLNHSNSIVAQTTAKLGMIKFDGQGHVTGFTEKAVVDNLMTTATDQPLSANQGKVLQDLLNNTIEMAITYADGSTETRRVVVKS